MKTFIRNHSTFLLSSALLVLLCFNYKWSFNTFAQNGFLSGQQQYKRVRTAIAEKGKNVSANLSANGLSTENVHVLFVAYKAENRLELYARKKTDSIYKRIAIYTICAASGRLGPKRREGDGQVPEGFYHIDRFNPVSNFYLSLGINYPNRSDSRKSSAKRLGGDIFIHGSCVTIGCLPMTNDKIKEIYLYAAYSRNNGQIKPPVYIFPFRMTDENMGKYKDRYSDNRALIDFWENLKTGYDKFVVDKTELSITVDNRGKYLF